MKIRVVAFATAAEALGSGAAEIEVPEGSRVGDLEALLTAGHPGLAPIWPRLAIAVEGTVAGPRTELAEGVEVALLPPVSGGMAGRERLVEEPLDSRRVLAAVAARSRGAVLLFEGHARDSFDGRPVTGLTYDAYRPMAERALTRIVAELEDASPGLAVEIVHRLGEVDVGEVSVAIATAAPHREAAYRASREALERLKREVPIWKRERFADGDAVWREAEPLAG